MKTGADPRPRFCADDDAAPLSPAGVSTACCMRAGRVSRAVIATADVDVLLAFSTL